MAAPDWLIEILSLAQKANRLIDNLLHCLRHGCRLGWMLNPDNYLSSSLPPPRTYGLPGRV